MTIGETLARARRDAGLSVADVSSQTRIRPDIVDGIEHNDFSASGGDFYARGQIRAIARAVGIHAGPLIDAYDANTSPAAEPASAAQTASVAQAASAAQTADPIFADETTTPIPAVQAAAPVEAREPAERTSWPRRPGRPARPRRSIRSRPRQHMRAESGARRSRCSAWRCSRPQRSAATCSRSAEVIRQRGKPQRRPGTGPAATARLQPGRRRITVALTGSLLRRRPGPVRPSTFSDPFTSPRSARAA